MQVTKEVCEILVELHPGARCRSTDRISFTSNNTRGYKARMYEGTSQERVIISIRHPNDYIRHWLQYGFPDPRQEASYIANKHLL
ncbi:uncharacterized protein LOC122573382 isoform X2 [Bombus pyrosoma]|uniref:uncharacterized protein LOC122573382 isoform X2 n=1 Tax=Bombus pyrosoma TaxID=396416 RepID=UPI001CB8F7BA|nr:uncharacterized protein LOC122573382 isoform X2 [Bombus pyrosoma]